MEKIGLFDLIDKFNSVANGKKEFEKQLSKENQPLAKNATTKLTDPQLSSPMQYIMNAKMQAFCKKHEEFAKTVKRN